MRKKNRYKNNTQKDIDKLLKLIKRLGSRIGRDKEIEEMMSIINSEFSDWEKPIEDPVTFEVDEESQKTNYSIRVKVQKIKIEMIFENFQ